MVDATRSEFAKFFPEEVRMTDGAVVVARRPSGASTLPSRHGAIDQLLADSTWQTIVDLPASDGRRYEYVLGSNQRLHGGFVAQALTSISLVALCATRYAPRPTLAERVGLRPKTSSPRRLLFLARRNTASRALHLGGQQKRSRLRLMPEKT